MSKKKKNINEKRIDYFKIIEISASLTGLLAFAYGVIFYILNNIYQQDRAKYFSIPINFFSSNIMEYTYIIGILSVPLIWIFYFLKNLSDEEGKMISCIEIALLEVLYFIIGMNLWNWKLDSFFSNYQYYKENPIKFVNILIILGILAIIAINLLLFIKLKSKFSIVIAAIIYIFFLMILMYGKRDIYFEVFLRSEESNRRYFVIGNSEGNYAIATAEVKKDCIIFSNEAVKIVKIEDIERFNAQIYRKSILK